MRSFIHKIHPIPNFLHQDLPFLVSSSAKVPIHWAKPWLKRVLSPYAQREKNRTLKGQFTPATAGSYCIKKRQKKNIHLHDFSAKQFVVIVIIYRALPRNRTTSSWQLPFLSCKEKSVMPMSFHHPWCLGLFLARDSTRSPTTSRWPFWAALNRGVVPSSMVPWSLLAPASTRNRTTSRCHSSAATHRGVVPSSVVPWSLLAPASTRNRTTSRCPASAAM